MIFWCCRLPTVFSYIFLTISQQHIAKKKIDFHNLKGLTWFFSQTKLNSCGFVHDHEVIEIWSYFLLISKGLVNNFRLGVLDINNYKRTKRICNDYVFAPKYANQNYHSTHCTQSNEAAVYASKCVKTFAVKYLSFTN